MLQKEGYFSPSQLWTALQTSWFYLPWPWSDCGAGLRATSTNTKEFFQCLYRTVYGSMRFPFCFFFFRAPSEHLLFLILPHRSDICGSHPGWEGGGSGFHIPRLLTALSVGALISIFLFQGDCKFPYLHIGHVEIHRKCV